MGKILVFCEHLNGKIKRSAQELLTAGKKSGNTVVAVAVGAQSPSLAAEVGKYGAQEFHVFKDPSFDQYNPELFTQMAADIIQKSGAQIVLASSSSIGKDLFPRVAARLQSGILSDCTQLTIQGDSVLATRPVYSAKCFAKMAFTDSPVQFVLMRANQLPIEESGGTAPSAQEHTVTPSTPLRTLIKEVVKGADRKSVV